MSEPSSSVPSEIADSEVEEQEPTGEDQEESVELDLDKEKLEAWEDVKSDYQVEPGGTPVPNSMDAPAPSTADSGDAHEDSAGSADSPDSEHADQDEDRRAD